MNNVLRLNYVMRALRATVMVAVAWGLLDGLNMGTLLSSLLRVRTDSSRMCSLPDLWTSPMWLCLSRHTWRLSLFLWKTQLFPLNMVLRRQGTSLPVRLGDIRPNNGARNSLPLLLGNEPGLTVSTMFFGYALDTLVF